VGRYRWLAFLQCFLLTTTWHSSSSWLQSPWNINIQYLLIGYLWDLINHSDGSSEDEQTAEQLGPPSQVVNLFDFCRKLILAGSWKYLSVFKIIITMMHSNWQTWWLLVYIFLLYFFIYLLQESLQAMHLS